MRLLSSNRLALVASALAVLGASMLPGGASALPVEQIPLGSVGFSLSVGGVEVYAPIQTGTPDGSTTDNPYDYQFASGTWQGGAQNTQIAWSGVTGDLDPGVSGSWTITNNTDSPQIYSFSVILPVLPVAPSSLMFGSSTISVSDANFDGSATLSTIGAPGYVGLIDLAPVGASALFPHSFSLSAPPASTTGQTQGFGTFPGSVPGPAVASTIGIQHVFQLSPRDSATLNSTFFLVAVPETGTLAMMLTGLAGLAVTGRRRR